MFLDTKENHENKIKFLFTRTRKIKRKYKLATKKSDHDDILNKALNYTHKMNQKKNLDFGEVIEVNGSTHEFIKGLKMIIHAAIDSSDYMLSASLDVQETNHGYIKMFRDIFHKYGAPKRFKTNRRASFIYDGLKEQH